MLVSGMKIRATGSSKLNQALYIVKLMYGNLMTKALCNKGKYCLCHKASSVCVALCLNKTHRIFIKLSDALTGTFLQIKVETLL